MPAKLDPMFPMICVDLISFAKGNDESESSGWGGIASLIGCWEQPSALRKYGADRLIKSRRFSN